MVSNCHILYCSHFHNCEDKMWETKMKIFLKHFIQPSNKWYVIFAWWKNVWNYQIPLNRYHSNISNLILMLVGLVGKAGTKLRLQKRSYLISFKLLCQQRTLGRWWPFKNKINRHAENCWQINGRLKLT